MSGGQGIMREFLNSVLIVVVLALVFGVILFTLQVGEQQRIQAEADTAARIAEADARARIAEADAEARVALAVIPAQEEKLFSFALLCGVGVVGMMVGMMGTVVLFNTRRRTSILEAMAVRWRVAAMALYDLANKRGILDPEDQDARHVLGVVDSVRVFDVAR